MRKGYSLLGRVWVVGGVIERGECKGSWLLKLLSVGFGDRVKCSRSLLCGLPPPTRLYSSLGTDRMDHVFMLMVKDEDGDTGPVQSAGVVVAGEVLASPLVEGVLLGEGVGEGALAIRDSWSLPDGEGWAPPGEGGVPGPCLNRSVSISHMCGVFSHLVGQ